MTNDDTASMRVSPSDFEQLKERLQPLRGTTVELYRLVAVEGLTKTEAAAKLDMTKQNAGQQLKRVEALLASRPADWERVTVWLPKDQAQQVREMEREAQRKINE